MASAVPVRFRPWVLSKRVGLIFYSLLLFKHVPQKRWIPININTLIISDLSLPLNQNYFCLK
jgi:hypothetical protein